MSPSVEEPQWRPEPTPEQIAAGEWAAAESAARIAAFQAELDARPSPQQAASDVALAPVIARLRARLEVRLFANRHSPNRRTRVLVDDADLSMLLDALDPETRP